MQATGRYKDQLLKVVSRSGQPQEWQRESLRRHAEKHFDTVRPRPPPTPRALLRRHWLPLPLATAAGQRPPMACALG